LGGTILWIMRRRVSSLTERLGLAMALSGALGNLIDRLVRGYVVDFVKVPHWPVFNVADIAIVLGFALLIVEGHRHAPERTLGS
jgi:signal peptidase II